MSLSAQVPLSSLRGTRRLVAVAAAAILSIGAVTFGNPADAHAGSNGQQIQVCTSKATEWGKAFIIGANQNGIVTASPNVQLSFVDFSTGDGRCNQLKNWWWKGVVTIHWYKSSGAYFRSSTCKIPVVNTFPYVHWVSCRAPLVADGQPFDGTTLHATA